jgi:tetratricopeptide (TPR) repeat protein
VSEDKSNEAVERELWERAAASEGITRADAYVALGRIAYEKGKFKDSLAICETARELFEQEKVDQHPRELFDVNVGISKNYEQLGKRIEAAQALGKAIEAAKIMVAKYISHQIQKVVIKKRLWKNSCLRFTKIVPLLPKF